MQAIITVFVFPPKLSFSNLVSFESLYGIKVLLFFFLSVREFIQFPRASRLLFIFEPSNIPFYYLSEVTFSDPARSINVNFE